MAAEPSSSSSSEPVENENNDCLDDDMLVWKEVAKSIQQTYYDIFKSRVWEKVDTEPSTWECMRRNVGFSLFGPPPEMPEESNLNTGYTAKQVKKIKKLCPLVMKHVEKEPKVVMFLFVGVKLKEQYKSLPVFRIIQNDEPDKDKDLFIDHKGRVYKGWQDFLDNNTVTAEVMCCPRDGLYSGTDGEVNVDFVACQTSSIPRKMITALNITTALAATSVGIATLLTPVAGGILLAVSIGGIASGVCGLGESVSSLVDRKTHGQTLSLKSSQVRNTALEIAGGTTSLILGGIDVVTMFFNSSFLRLTSTLTIGSSAFKGLELLNSLTNIALKIRINDKITPLEIFQFSASVLFFSGSLLSMKSAYLTLKSMSLPDSINPIPGVLSTVEDVEKAVLPEADENLPTKEARSDKVEKNVKEKCQSKLLDMPGHHDENVKPVKFENTKNEEVYKNANDNDNVDNNNSDDKGDNESLPFLNFLKSWFYSSENDKEIETFDMQNEKASSEKRKTKSNNSEKLEDEDDGIKVLRVVAIDDDFLPIENQGNETSNNSVDKWKTLKNIAKFLNIAKKHGATYVVSDESDSAQDAAEIPTIPENISSEYSSFKENSEDEKVTAQKLNEMLLRFERKNSAAEMRYREYAQKRPKPNLLKKLININRIANVYETKNKENEDDNEDQSNDKHNKANSQENEDMGVETDDFRKDNKDHTAHHKETEDDNKHDTEDNQNIGKNKNYTDGSKDDTEKSEDIKDNKYTEDDTDGTEENKDNTKEDDDTKNENKHIELENDNNADKSKIKGKNEDNKSSQNEKNLNFFEKWIKRDKIENMYETQESFKGNDDMKDVKKDKSNKEYIKDDTDENKDVQEDNIDKKAEHKNMNARNEGNAICCKDGTEKTKNIAENIRVDTEKNKQDSEQNEHDTVLKDDIKQDNVVEEDENTYAKEKNKDISDENKNENEITNQKNEKVKQENKCDEDENINKDVNDGGKYNSKRPKPSFFEKWMRINMTGKFNTSCKQQNKEGCKDVSEDTNDIKKRNKKDNYENEYVQSSSNDNKDAKKDNAREGTETVKEIKIDTEVGNNIAGESRGDIKEAKYDAEENEVDSEENKIDVEGKKVKEREYIEERADNTEKIENDTREGDDTSTESKHIGHDNENHMDKSENKENNKNDKYSQEQQKLNFFEKWIKKDKIENIYERDESNDSTKDVNEGKRNKEYIQDNTDESIYVEGDNNDESQECKSMDVKNKSNTTCCKYETDKTKNIIQEIRDNTEKNNRDTQENEHDTEQVEDDVKENNVVEEENKHAEEDNKENKNEGKNDDKNEIEITNDENNIVKQENKRDEKENKNKENYEGVKYTLKREKPNFFEKWMRINRVENPNERYKQQNKKECKNVNEDIDDIKERNKKDYEENKNVRNNSDYGKEANKYNKREGTEPGKEIKIDTKEKNNSKESNRNDIVEVEDEEKKSEDNTEGVRNTEECKDDAGDKKDEEKDKYAIDITDDIENSKNDTKKRKDIKEENKNIKHECEYESEENKIKDENKEFKYSQTRRKPNFFEKWIKRNKNRKMDGSQELKYEENEDDNENTKLGREDKNVKECDKNDNDENEETTDEPKNINVYNDNKAEKSKYMSENNEDDRGDKDDVEENKYITEFSKGDTEENRDTEDEKDCTEKNKDEIMDIKYSDEVNNYPKVKTDDINEQNKTTNIEMKHDIEKANNEEELNNGKSTQKEQKPNFFEKWLRINISGKLGESQELKNKKENKGVNEDTIDITKQNKEVTNKKEKEKDENSDTKRVNKNYIKCDTEVIKDDMDENKHFKEKNKYDREESILIKEENNGDRTEDNENIEDDAKDVIVENKNEHNNDVIQKNINTEVTKEENKDNAN